MTVFNPYWAAMMVIFIVAGIVVSPWFLLGAVAWVLFGAAQRQ